MDSSGITPVMNMNDGDGFGGGFMWIFGLIVLLALFNGGGFGFGGNAAALGYENLATSNEVQRGFDNQNLQAQTRDILAAVNAGTAQSVATTNQTFHDMLMANQGLYNEVARDISNLAVGQANLLARQNECCCETKQMIMQNNYDGALRDAATNANFTAQIQSVKDMIAQNKIETLEKELSGLQLQSALSNVVRYPNNTFYAVPSPCFNGCGCNA